jgi:tetraacyldisaccharide 4'-kinase
LTAARRPDYNGSAPRRAAVMEDGRRTSKRKGDGTPLLALTAPTPEHCFPREPAAGAGRRRFLAVVRGEATGVGPALARLGLAVASWPYGAVVRLRNFAFDRRWLSSQRAAVPVVSVGNLTTGGVGKTPFVEFIAEHYRRRDVRVAVLSRGYGAADGPNDEALVLEANLPDVPHLQGPDRAALAATAVEELETEVLVLDDGFQHRRLARDLEIVLIDATDPWGGGRMLPRGLLREPPSGLRRAHMVALTRCDQATHDEIASIRERVRRLAPHADVVEAVHRPTELVDAEGAAAPVDHLRGQPIAAFCGLGNPEAFRRTLVACGADLRDFRTFPDHHSYSRADVEELRAWAGALPVGAAVVVSQKDLVKLGITEIGGRPLWALRVRLDVTSGREALARRLDAVLEGRA